MSRPDWDNYFLLIAERVSLRATCPRRHVGVVIVDRANHIISTGYNGAPPGAPQCDVVGCDIQDGHCKRAHHADVNAIEHASEAGKGNLLGGSTMYIYGGTPCINCAMEINKAGISRVVCYGSYPDKDAAKHLRAAEITLVVLDAIHRPMPDKVVTYDEALRAIADHLVETLLSKHHDYGPGANEFFGLTGIIVRGGDKFVRLWNLIKKGASPQHESYFDGFLDAAGYGFLGVMSLRGWLKLPSFFKKGDGL